MADDNPAGPDHTQNMSCIDTPVGYLRVVRIDATKDYSISKTRHDLAHSFAEESRTRAEIFWWQRDGSSRVGVVDDFVDSLHLCDECRVTQ